jgi:hypothetical protein
MAMSKKKYKELMLSNEPRYLSIINSIELEILMFLQLETRNNIVLDNGQPLLYQNKFIHYPKEAIQDRNIIPFDLINNSRLMQFLFSIYIRNYQIENNIQIQQFFLTPLNNEGYGSAVIRQSSMTSDIESGMYRNESLRFIDLILKNECSLIYNPLVLKEIDEYINFIKEEKILARKG